MALTATAQSALPPERTWDEVIVPALRKRLKDESNVLAKRISAASITSADDPPSSQYYAPPPRPGTSTSSHSHTNSKPSAIPRPSISSSRAAESTYAASLTPSKRARALSQPFPFEPPPSSAEPMPLFAESTRSVSPVNPPKGTRIPVSRARTGSTSSQAHSTYNGSTNGRVNGYSRHNGGEPSDTHLYPVEEKTNGRGPSQSPPQSQTSRSTIQVPRRKVSDIFQEPAPFPPNSLSSSQSQFEYAPERMSSESEEHPFEHWYRGDIARNGGVGELRVARRQEMLDIANYGHTLRKASGKSHSGLSSRSRSSSRGRDTPNGRARGRHRADSAGARESICIDEDAMKEGKVMDERPLTDLDDDDDDDDGDNDELDDYYTQAVQPHPNGSISSPSLERSDTPSSRHTHNNSRSRIPQPTSRSRTTTPTPAKPSRSTSESGLSAPSPPPPDVSPIPRSATQPVKTQGLPPPTTVTASASTPATPTTKGRAKSPANSTPQSSSKKLRAKAPPSSMQKRMGAKEDNRRSVGQYPLPDGDEDAIPTWTQPRPANGNWDDVVLPVVARKKGLQDQYETADGTPKPREPEPMVIEPAPGTFGYDATKRRKRWSGNPEQIPMDEFGLPKPSSPTIEEDPGLAPPDEHLPSPTTPPAPATPLSVDRLRIESPPPFAHYQPGGRQMQAMQLMPDKGQQQQQQPPQQVDEDRGAGCCKCVIM